MVLQERRLLLLWLRTECSSQRIIKTTRSRLATIIWRTRGLWVRTAECSDLDAKSVPSEFLTCISTTTAAFLHAAQLLDSLVLRRLWRMPTTRQVTKAQFNQVITHAIGKVYKYIRKAVMYKEAAASHRALG